jgi:hypothetical protein
MQGISHELSCHCPHGHVQQTNSRPQVASNAHYGRGSVIHNELTSFEAKTSAFSTQAGVKSRCRHGSIPTKSSTIIARCKEAYKTEKQKIICMPIWFLRQENMFMRRGCVLTLLTICIDCEILTSLYSSMICYSSVLMLTRESRGSVDTHLSTTFYRLRLARDASFLRLMLGHIRRSIPTHICLRLHPPIFVMTFTLRLFVLAVVIYFISWVLWHLFRMYFVKSSLHAIPGPPPASLISGMSSRIFDDG